MKGTKKDNPISIDDDISDAEGDDSVESDWSKETKSSESSSLTDDPTTNMAMRSKLIRYIKFHNMFFFLFHFLFL